MGLRGKISTNQGLQENYQRKPTPSTVEVLCRLQTSLNGLVRVSVSHSEERASPGERTSNSTGL